MELDEEDYEALGYGQFSVDKPQKLGTTLAKSGLLLTSGKWVRNTNSSKAVADSLAWRKKHPERFKAINKKYRQSAKGKATAKRYRKANPNPKSKETSAARNKAWYKKLKADPVRYAAYLKKQVRNRLKRYHREKAERGKSTTTNKT